MSFISFMGVDPFSSRFAPDRCPAHFSCGPVPPTFKFVLVPL